MQQLDSRRQEKNILAHNTVCFRKLNEEGTIVLRHISSKNNSIDFFTKMLSNLFHTKCAGYYCADKEF